MGDKTAGRNFPQAPRQDERDTQRRYNSEGYYRSNRALADSGHSRSPDPDDQETYDDFISGKEENYDAEGYYGSNYGSVSELNRGRDFERNAGYRDNYSHLTTGQWPGVEEAASCRGIDLHWQERRPGVFIAEKVLVLTSDQMKEFARIFMIFCSKIRMWMQRISKSVWRAGK